MRSLQHLVAPFRLLLPLTTLLLLSPACGDDADDVVLPGCNGLGGAGCVLPWPSAIYEIDDAASPSGRRLDIPDNVLPRNASGVTPAVAKYNAMDGWSANVPLLMAWEGGFDPAGLPPATDPQKSLEPSSPTVLVDLETGERVPHFAEEDLQAKEVEAAFPSEVALLIRPVVRLRPGKRYAVGIRNTLKAPGGGALPIQPGFKALVDGKATGNERLERVRASYADIFAKLEAAGAPRGELVVAWSFTVRTDEPVYRDVLDARDAMLTAIGDGSGFTFTVESDGLDGADPEETLRIVEGTFDVPNVLDGDGGNMAVLNRGSDGRATINTGKPILQAPFVVVIPKCAEDPQNLPLPIVIYGHGLIGSLDEAKGGYPRAFAQRACVAIIATDWRGMSAADLTAVALALNDIDQVDLVMEKLVQGVNQFVALETLARLVWSESPTFQLGDAKLLDATNVSYYGISQGGIFGGTFMAIDPFVTRGVLGVPAASYSYIIERSTNWKTYRIFMYNAYTDNELQIQILLTLVQAGWDLTDPITHVSHLTGDKDALYPGVPRKSVLLQMAVGDAQVANIGAELWARTAGTKVLGPALYTPFGLEVAAGPLDSALTQWDEHRTPLPPGGNVTLEDNGTHGSLRKRAKINEQIVHFFETGEIIQTCTSDGTPTGTPVACDCSNTPTDLICGPPQF